MHNNNFMNAPLVRSDVRAISMTSWYVKTSNKPSHCLDEKKNENTRRMGGGNVNNDKYNNTRNQKISKKKLGKKKKKKKKERRKKKQKTHSQYSKFCFLISRMIDHIWCT